MQTHMVLLRSGQTACSLVVLGFNAYVAHWWHSYWHEISPAEVNFNIFASLCTMLTLAWQVYSRNAPGKVSRYVSLGLDVLNVIFWFGGFVSLAAFLGARVCFGNVCNVARAAIVMAALEWLLFAVTTTYLALFVVKSSRAPVNPDKVVQTISPPLEVVMHEEFEKI